MIYEIIEPFKDEMYLCYIMTQSVPRCKHCTWVIKTKLLILRKVNVAVCSQNT
jgi:hypothetical protein